MHGKKVIVTSTYSQYLHLRRSNYEQTQKPDKKASNQTEIFEKIKKKKIAFKISGSSAARQPTESLTVFWLNRELR